MEDLLSKINIKVNEKIFLKDPESSELGKRIISGGIDMIEGMGFENLTFRKLGKEINSTEASIYRYFESKHKLLLYLTSWYWGWTEYRLVFGIANVASADDRLERALSVLTRRVEETSVFPHINEAKLYRIVISESSKAYLTKEVDQENRDGFFAGFKQLVTRVANIIQEINPQYKYAHMLASATIEGAHHQRYFADHLPRLTDVVEGEDAICEFYKKLVFKAIKE